MTDRKFLDKVYDLATPAATRAMYDDWAGSYDAEITVNGYATPGRIARALAAQTDDLTAPILDFGCGTGISGAALRQAGFTSIDGADLSAEMLNGARAKALYRKLWQIEAGEDLPVTPGTYGAITAIGVIGVGAAPIAVFDTILNALAPGGRFALSFNDHALAEPRFAGRLDKSVTDGETRLLHSDYGDHLPGIDLKSRIYILEKA